MMSFELSEHRSDGHAADPPWILLSAFIKSFLETEPRDYEILRRYHGLDGSSAFTLEEIGAYLGVTRERVRQLRNRARVRVMTAFANEHPVIVERVSDEVAALAKPLVPETTLTGELAELYNARPDASDTPALRLLLEFVGGSCVSADKLELDPTEELYWHIGSEIDVRKINTTAKHVRRLLADKPDGISLFEIVVSCNRGGVSHRVEPEDVEQIIALLPDVDASDRERVQTRFLALRSMMDQAYRILTEEGAPLHFRDIARHINKRALAEGGELRLRDVRSLTARLSDDDRFEPIGRSGRWKLASWDHVEGRPIADLIEDALFEAQEPTSFADVHEYVLRRRQGVPLGTIYTLVNMLDDRFVSVGDGRVALPAWGFEAGDRGERMSSQRIHDIVHDVLADWLAGRDRAQIKLSDAIRLLRDKGGIAEPTARHRLDRTEGVRRIDGDGPQRLEIVAAELEADSGSQSSLHQKVSNAVLHLLRSRPDRRALLRDVRDHVWKSYRVKAPTFYSMADSIAGVRKQREGTSVFLEADSNSVRSDD